MPRIALLAWLVTGGCMISEMSGAQPARVWEASLVIPTYELGPPDPNPAFPGTGTRRPI